MSVPIDTGSPIYAIGLDVGGTKIAGGIVELTSGQVLTRRVVPTQADRGGEAVLAAALAMVEELMAETTALACQAMGVGVGVAELVDGDGHVTSGHTIAWQGLPVQGRLSQLIPTVVEADVRAAARAEARFGAGRTFDPFVYVTVGTGIGSCLVQNGVPYAGARGNALVLATGHLTVICSRCGATLRPVLEEIASGPALVHRYNEHSARLAARGEDVMAAAQAGDPAAVEVVRTAGEALGVSVGWLVNVLDPEAIVVGGGLGLAGGLYWSSFVASTRAHIWADNSRGLPIVPAQLGVDAGLIGAATTVWQQVRDRQEPIDVPR